MKREVIYSVRGPKLLPEMTSEDVAEELKHTDLIIFPVASNEVHGPHLPLIAGRSRAQKRREGSWPG